MTGLLAVTRNELQRIFSLRPVQSVLIVAILIYAVFYPQPYLNETLRDIPVVVVDQDGTTSSRELARRIDATADVAIAFVLPDVANAEREIYRRHAYGILLIPKDFERELLHGRPSPLALYADASYFLIYQRVSAGVQAAARSLGAEVETARLIAIGIDPTVAAAATDPMPLTAVPLFNPQGGYATYLLPAALVLILQQTLLIGTGLLGTLPGGIPVNHRKTPGAPETILGKLLAYLALEAIILPFYLVVLPYLYGVPRLGSVAMIISVGIPFLLAVGALGLIVAAVVRKPLAVQLVLAAIGLPFFFLAGFTWPGEAMPEFVRLVATLVPSTAAIDAFVRVSQLGASLSDVRGHFLTLWGLAVAYAGIAIGLEYRKGRSRGASGLRATP